MSIKKFVLIVLITAIVFTGVSFIYEKLQQPNAIQEALTTDVINSAIFNCADNKTIQAVFLKDNVSLTLSDGRHLQLPQGMSGSGACYATTDESFVFWNKGDTAVIEEGKETTYKDCVTGVKVEASTQLANPASVNCSKSGGHLVIEKRGDGGEYGVCYFEDNKACEEWALFRGECPKGGVKTIGLDSIDQKYCAWSGGQTLAVANSVCTLKDGSTCSTGAFYNGKCSSTNK
jgi:Putative hemolysin